MAVSTLAAVQANWQHRSDNVQRVDRILIQPSPPRYPMRAMARELTGWVELDLTVDQNGHVLAATVANNCARKGRGPCTDSPNAVFNKAALNAASGLRFKTGKRETIRHRMTFDLAP